MSEVGLYTVMLSFTPAEGVVGAGSMTLALTVNAPTGALHGQAHGTILEGAEHPQTFTAEVSGSMHSTGYGGVVRVGAVSGDAGIQLPPPAIGTVSAPFTASFGLDSDWNGEGQFTVGAHTYKSKVTITE